MMNSGVQGSVSQEYAAKSILHESLHAFLQNNGMALNNYNHHNDMAINYASLMANSLMSLFPSLTPHHANALARHGLQTSAAWSGIPENVRNDYINIAYAYRMGSVLGTWGTRPSSCP
jgi:hypothetical protein